MRFQYDPITDCSVKFNDKCEFPEVLDLSNYISKEGEEANPEDAVYVLHAVLVHSGDNHGGHYVVFINPKCDGKWCKFDDDVVSRCTKKEAVDSNFGGEGEEVMTARHCTNAYMLVYIQQSRMTDILSSVSQTDIPDTCQERLQEEKRIEAIRRKEKNEAHLYMSVKVILEDAFFGHQGNDLFDPEMAPTHDFLIKKSATLKEFLSTVATDLGLPVERLRPWQLIYHLLAGPWDKSLRPFLVEMEDWDRSMVDVTENSNPWTIFLQLLKPGVAKFDEKRDVLLFFKYYCPRRGRIHYMGHLCLAITTKLNTVLPKLCAMANIPRDSKLIIWEEVKPNMLERIEVTNQPLEHIPNLLLNVGGISIIVLQRDPGERQSFELPTAKDYFRDLSYKVGNIYLFKGSVAIQDFSFQVVVKFCDKNIPNDEGFSLELSQRMNYEQLAEKVAAHLDTDPSQLEFFKGSGDDGPGHPIR